MSSTSLKEEVDALRKVQVEIDSCLGEAIDRLEELAREDTDQSASNMDVHISTIKTLVAVNRAQIQVTKALRAAAAEAGR